MATKIFAWAIVAIACFSQVQGTVVTIVNNCPYSITAFARAGSDPTNSYSLGSGASQDLNVGTAWTGGLVFATVDGSEDNAETTQLEMTVDGGGALDYYDISLVNAYNLPAEIQPYAIVGTPVDGGCGTPICTISDIASFCQFPNVDGGNYCTNTDGPGLVPTAGTEMFKSACPDAYSYSKDDSSSTYACPTGTNYYFRYCP